VYVLRPASRWSEFKPRDGRLFYSQKTYVTSYEREVCVSYTSALCSRSRLSLGAALERRGFITKDTSVCRLICAAIWRTNSTTNKGEIWALQRTKKPVGLRLSVLAMKFNKNIMCHLLGWKTGKAFDCKTSTCKTFNIIWMLQELVFVALTDYNFTKSVISRDLDSEYCFVSESNLWNSVISSFLDNHSLSI